MIQNDFVKTLLQSNPVTSLVSNIVTGASMFLKERGQVGRKLTDIEQAYDTTRVNEFINGMRPYIQFYDSLTILGNQYLAGLDKIRVKHLAMSDLAHNYHIALKEQLGISAQTTGFEAKERVVAFLMEEEAEDLNFDFQAFFSSTGIKEVFVHVEAFEALEKNLAVLTDEHQAIYNQYTNEYLRFIDKAKTLTNPNNNVKSYDQLALNRIKNRTQYELQQQNRQFSQQRQQQQQQLQQAKHD